MNDTKHLWRVFILVFIGIVVVMVGRLFFVPKTFGDFGHYRALNVQEQMAFEVKYNGPDSCEPCHTDEHSLWKANAHKTIICEDCHAPFVTHIKNDEKFSDMEINKSASFCLRCHQMLSARSSDFPQINPVEHLVKFKMELSDTVCISCHNPHNPMPRDTADKKDSTKILKE